MKTRVFWENENTSAGVWLEASPIAGYTGSDWKYAFLLRDVEGGFYTCPLSWNVVCSTLVPVLYGNAINLTGL